MSIARSRRELAIDVGMPDWADPQRYAPLANALAGKKSAIMRPRAGKARLTLALMVLSFLGGVWSRDELSTQHVEAAHAALSQTREWIARRLGGAHATSSANTVASALPRTIPVSAPASMAVGAPRASTPEPPEVSFSSLPRAPRKAFVRAPVPAGPPTPVHAHAAPPASPEVEDIPAAASPPAHARAVPSPAAEAAPDAPAAPVHTRTTPSQATPEADTADLIPEPKATAEPPKATPSPQARTREAPPPAPGSLEDLIRKEVQKEQSSKH